MRYSALNQIEEATKQSVSIKTNLDSFTAARCHPQHQSPLFLLPTELRKIIFSQATQPYYAPGTFLDDTDVNYRAEHHATWTISTSLLKTCRRIWLEANHFPIQQAHHCFYLPRQRDTGRTNQLSPGYQEFATRLTQNNRPLLKSVHLFANAGLFSHQQGHNPGPLLLTTGACPEILTITIRHVDWPGWETSIPLSHSSPIEWLHTLLAYPASPRLREIRPELETLSATVDSELRPIIDGLRERYASFDRTDELGNPVTLALQSPLPERKWTGPMGPGQRARYSGPEKRLEYKIFGLAWKVRRNGAKEDEDVSGEGGVRDLPAFSFRDADREPSGKIWPENAKVRRQWEERWDREWSLLKFAG